MDGIYIKEGLVKLADAIKYLADRLAEAKRG
jgi:hypothetical protein